MPKYFAHIAYNGFAYAGWQRQPKATGIQEVIEDRLSQYLKVATKIHGCGRTDAMVHACQYFFQFQTERTLDPPQTINILNRSLPDDISIYHLIEVNNEANVQLDATRRTYNYFMHFVPNAFLIHQSAYYPIDDLNIDAMVSAISILPEFTDFSGLCKTPNRHSTTFCQIDEVNLFANPDHSQMRFEISANRFLRGMIRILAGKLLEIGKGNLSVDAFADGIRTKTLPKFLNLAYPQGLYLSAVKYPYINLSTQWNKVPVYNNTKWIKQ